MTEQTQADIREQQGELRGEFSCRNFGHNDNNRRFI